MVKTCIIPARGGSKRLPKKNIIDFMGKPIIAYTIEAAFKANIFEEIIVSTDDEQIAEVAKNFGSKIDFRPKELGSDYATVSEVCLEYLKRDKSNLNSNDIFCCLYPTAPLRAADDIKQTVQLLDNEKYNFSLAVTEYHYPPNQALKIKNDNELEPMWPNLVFNRRDEIKPLCVDNGSTYAFRIGKFIEFESFYIKPFKGYVMPRERSVDIDEKKDLELALFYSKQKKTYN
tara:strand:- start:889 stop:1581 length:693 start_codon:yes stop_codon:yes gene_type:complete